jgi:protein-L-isoaspartate(D-aspartate) O-methyltransferase
MKPVTEKHLALLRRHMVEIIDMHFDLASEEIGKAELSHDLREALLRVPRHLFVPQSLAGLAYQDGPLPIGFDKTISQPFMAALMLELLKIDGSATVLEVGTGLGYQAAVMAEMGARVFSVEVVEEFAQAAEHLLTALGHSVAVRAGDGTRGWADHAPFDAVLVTAAAAEVPPALLEQLKAGGRLVLPLGGEDVQALTVVEKQLDGSVQTRSVLPVRFTRLEVG